MATIKFKARDIDANCWIPSENFLISPDGKLYTRNQKTDPWAEEVIPYVLIQFTGIHDADRREIYDGDILAPIIVNTKGRYVVRRLESAACFHLRPVGENEGGYSLWVNSCGYAPYRIVGNIYDNPEMLIAKTKGA